MKPIFAVFLVVFSLLVLAPAYATEQDATLTNPNPSPPVIRERQDSMDPLKDFEQFVDDQGGLYFGLGLFPMLTMIIGFLAGKNTVRIFTLIVLFLMGIFHASGLFVYPDWYWAMSLLLGTVMVLGRQKSS